jgi:hypothetical protein
VPKSRLLLLLAFLILSAAARAQSACPWLTEGTAAAMLGGPTTATTNILPSSNGTCTFTFHQGASPSSLEITVAPNRPALCPVNSKALPAIGNEALICTAGNSDIVTARVRTLYFTIRLTIGSTQSPPVSAAERQTIVQRIAEQVAGSLY